MLGLVSVLGYTHISNFRLNHKGGRTSILIRECIPFKRRKDLDVFIEKEVETTYIEVTAKNGKHVVTGSLYHSPNTNETPFINHITTTLDKIKTQEKQKECIMGMDHNLDLLKSQQHHATGKFLECMLDHNMLPAITSQSHINQTSATLIDNIFISGFFQQSFDSCLL